MNRLALLLFGTLALLLAGCGEYVAPSAPRSPVEVQQTQVALTGITPQPTFVAPTPNAEATSTALQQRAAAIAVPDDDPRAKGSPGAPVLFVEYSDYECPFCQRFVSETMTQIEEQYVKTGVVRIAYRDYPLESHPSAMIAAIAGRCAANQGQFWPMHDRLFLSHGEEWGGVPRRDRDVFVEFAGELQLDTGAFERCLDDLATGEAVRLEAAAGEQAGVRATPNFFINGEMVQGAQPFGVFQRAIEQAQGK